MFEMHTNIKFPSAFAVVGTDTEVGKTVISTLLMNLLKGTYWKPVQAGTEPETDTKFVKDHCSLPQSHFLPEAYVFSRPLAPSQAARLEGKEIDLESLKIPAHKHSPLIIEGAGGIMSPLSEKHLYLDLLKMWKIPVVLVSRSTLGTINHTLLSLMALQSNNIDVLGIIFNGPKNTLNKESIENYSHIPVIAEMTPVDDLKEVCKTLYAEKV